MWNSSIWSIDITLSDATTLGQSGSEKDDNEGVLGIPQSSSITRAALSDYLMSYIRHSLGVVLPLCRDAVSGLDSGKYPFIAKSFIIPKSTLLSSQLCIWRGSTC